MHRYASVRSIVLISMSSNTSRVTIVLATLHLNLYLE
jgi:hypothetical protein